MGRVILILQAQRVAKLLGSRWVLNGADLEIVAGECVLLTGPNGAGKSTLLKILALLTAPTSGRVLIGGRTAERESPAFRRQIGAGFHETLIYPDLSAVENLIFFGKLYGLPDPESHADAWLERVGLRLYRNDQAGRFSRGMQQRLSLARAFLHEPNVLLLDEPYTGLDEQGVRWLTQTLAEAKEKGKAILIVSHDLQRPATVADRSLALVSGQIQPAGAA